MNPILSRAQHVIPHAINTENPDAVADALKALFGADGGHGSFDLIDQAVAGVARMFSGRHPGYQAIDMEYHDLDHTLQVTMCMAYLLKGRSETDDKPELGIGDQELAIIAALLHDTGFSKRMGTIQARGRNTHPFTRSGVVPSVANICPVWVLHYQRLRTFALR